MKEDAEEDVTIKADQIESPRKILKPRKTIARTRKVSDTVENIKPPDNPSNKAEVEKSENAIQEASESCEMTAAVKESNSSGSAPLTKKDLEEMWNSFAEENGYQTINLTNKHKI